MRTEEEEGKKEGAVTQILHLIQPSGTHRHVCRGLSEDFREKTNSRVFYP